jgi:hypothetical protein
MLVQRSQGTGRMTRSQINDLVNQPSGIVATLSKPALRTGQRSTHNWDCG